MRACPVRGEYGLLLRDCILRLGDLRRMGCRKAEVKAIRVGGSGMLRRYFGHVKDHIPGVFKTNGRFGLIGIGALALKVREMVQDGLERTRGIIAVGAGLIGI